MSVRRIKRNSEMKNLFEFVSTLTLQTVNSYSDGLPVWQEFALSGRLLYEKKILSDDASQAPVYSAVFFIPSTNREPRPGDRIKYNAITYDVTKVEPKRNLKGTLAAFRCTCGRES